MYIPKPFQMTDEKLAFDVIKEHSFATLVSQHQGLPCATHLPLIMDKGHQYLYGHFARSNPQWEDIHDQKVLAIFQGPHCYISPSWYETAKAVPTWNYVSVHVYGEVRWIDDEKELMDSLHELVLKYEAPNSPYRLQDVDASYIAALNQGVQGFKIKISKIEGSAKLSQNHSAERQNLVIEQLEKIPRENEQQIAQLMGKNLRVTIADE